MSNRFTAVVAGGVGVIAALAGFALAVVIDQRPTVHDAAKMGPSKAPRFSHAHGIGDEAVDPPVLVIPTVTIVGEVPRHGAAEMQRPDARDPRRLLGTAPWRSAPAAVDAVRQ